MADPVDTRACLSRYWPFYWPLALTSIVSLLASQFQNGVLASYPDAARQLAAFALASGCFQFLDATLIFLPQMTNVMARSAQGRRLCFRFTVLCGVALTAPLLALAFSPAGARFVRAVFRPDASLEPLLFAYLRLLTPLLIVNGLRHYLTGLLVQARRTRQVTALNVLHVATVLSALLGGRRAGWPAVAVLPGALLAASFLDLFLCAWFWRRLERELRAAPDHGPPVTMGEIVAFFWPVAATSTLFAFSRPVLYAFINRMPDAVITVAALRVGFDLAILFHNPCNQFRHVFVTFGREDPAGVRRFMVWIMFALFALMAAFAFTPLSRLALQGLMGIEEPVLGRALTTLRVLVLTPLAITLRNAYHGELMVRRRTVGMAVGAIGRIGIIFAGAWGLYALGLMNNAASGALLVAGFAVEGIVSRLFVRPEPAREPAAR